MNGPQHLDAGVQLLAHAEENDKGVSTEVRALLTQFAQAHIAAAHVAALLDLRTVDGRHTNAWTKVTGA